MPTTGGTKSAASSYQLQLFSNLPLYTTQLVCETKFPFCERIQVSAPADVVPILQEYFRLKDREEMILVLLDTANTILGLSLVSVGGRFHRGRIQVLQESLESRPGSLRLGACQTLCSSPQFFSP